MANIYDTTTKFTKYVKFLSNQFDISVEFDQPGLKRKENTIYLPSLYSMSQNELDILWGVLLQEAGFLKHSELTNEENLLKIKSKNQLHLIKTLEAVKVEKQLLSKYDGARDMLSPLYERTVEDNNLKEKFFPDSKGNVWNGLCYWLHESLMGKDSTLIEENVAKLLGSAAATKKVYKFIKDTTLQELLSRNNIDKSTSTTEVIKLANKIHNMYFASHDPSEKISYAEKIKAKKKMEELTQKTKDKLDLLKKDLEENSKKLQQLKDKQKEIKKAIEPELTKAQLANKEKAIAYNNIADFANYSNKRDSIKNSHQYNENQLNNNLEKIKNNKEQIENIKNRLHPNAGEDVAIAEKNKEILEKLGFKEESTSLNDLEKTAEKLQEQLSSFQDNIKDIQQYQKDSETLEKLKNKIEKQEKQLSQVTEREQNIQTKEQSLKDKLNCATSEAEKEVLKEKLNDNNEKLHNNAEQKQEVQNKLNELNEQKSETEKSLTENNFSNEEQKSQEQLSEQISQNKENIAQMKEQLNAVNKELSHHTVDEEKKEKLQNKQASLEAKNAELSAKNEQKSQQLDKLQAELDKLDEKFDAVKELFKGLGEEEIAKELEQASKDKIQAEAELNKIRQPLNELNAQMEGQKKDVQKKEQNATAEILSEIQKLDPVMKDLGIDLGILPQFIEMEGWDEANEVQKDFDIMQTQKTNQIVTNGAGAGLKGYETLIEMTNKINELEQINVQELFKGIIKTNPLEAMAQEQKSQTLQDYDNYDFGKSVRAHAPATKAYDRVEQKHKLTDPVKIQNFNNIKQKLNPVIREIRMAMKNKFKFTKKPFYKGGKEEGDLDSRNIYRLATRLDNDFYEVNNPKFINKIAATIVIDMSGSINKEYAEEGIKSLKAALLLSEGFKEVHIPHEIVAYGAEFCEEMSAQRYSDFYNRRSHSLKLEVLKNFEDKDNSGLGNFEVQPIDNCDGESIALAYSRVKKRPEKQKLVFVISDGKPFLNDADVNVLDEDLRKVVRAITEDKNHIFAIGFNDGPEQLYSNRYQKIDTWKDLIDMVKSINLEGKLANRKPVR